MIFNVFYIFVVYVYYNIILLGGPWAQKTWEVHGPKRLGRPMGPQGLGGPWAHGLWRGGEGWAPLHIKDKLQVAGSEFVSLEWDIELAIASALLSDSDG